MRKGAREGFYTDLRAEERRDVTGSLLHEAMPALRQLRQQRFKQTHSGPQIPTEQELFVLPCYLLAGFWLTWLTLARRRSPSCIPEALVEEVALPPVDARRPHLRTQQKRGDATNETVNSPQKA